MQLLPYKKTMKSIRKKRKELGLQQKELANRAGISPSQLNRMEKENTEANYSTVYKIWRILKKKEERNLETAEEIMNSPIVWMKPEDTCLEAIKIMREKDYSQLPVKEDGRSIGHISESILMSVQDPEKQVSEVMEGPFMEVKKEKSENIVNAILEESSAVLVTNSSEKNTEYIGIITKADLL